MKVTNNIGLDLKAIQVDDYFVVVDTKAKIKENDKIYSLKSKSIFNADSIEYLDKHNIIEDFDKSFYINSNQSYKIIASTKLIDSSIPVIKFVEQSEIWKDIVGYEGLYQISNYGNIKGGKRNKNLKLSLFENRYYRVSLCKDNIKSNKLVHRLVAEAFIENSDNTLEVNHIDGNKLNNYYKNLEWVSHQENTSHAKNNNLYPSSIKAYQSKLTLEQVEIIRNSNLTMDKLANMFNVTKKVIWLVKHNKSYKEPINTIQSLNQPKLPDVINLEMDYILSKKDINQAKEGDFVMNNYGSKGIINSLSNDIRVGIGNFIEVSQTGDNGHDTLYINGYKIYEYKLKTTSTPEGEVIIL